MTTTPSPTFTKALLPLVTGATIVINATADTDTTKPLRPQCTRYQPEERGARRAVQELNEVLADREEACVAE